MRRHFSLVALVLSVSFANVALGQISISPSGGLTIKTLLMEETGWAFVEFVESESTITNNCTEAGAPYVGFPKVLWVDPNTWGSKGTYATLLAMKMADRKVSGITLVNQGSYCTLYAVTVE